MSRVTDHAVLRHLERTYGVDVEHYRRELDTPAVETAVRIGCPCVVGHHGERLLLKDGKVVTVVGKRYGKRDRRTCSQHSAVSE